MNKDSARPNPSQAQHPDKVSEFWEAFKKETGNQGVKDASQRWYEMRVEKYIKAAGGKRLREHTHSDVNPSLSVSGKI